MTHRIVSNSIPCDRIKDTAAIQRPAEPMSKIDYTTRVHDIAGAPQDLSAQRGRVMLIVNTASKCGYTPQLKGLQRLHDDVA